MIRNIKVWMHHAQSTLFVGEFHHDNQKKIGQLVYDKEYLSHPLAMPIDPATPLKKRTSAAILHDGIYGGMRDALPDSWGRLVVANRANKDPSLIDDVDLLLLGGQARTGCLEFREDGNSNYINIPSFNDWDDLVAAMDDLQAGRPVDPEILEMLVHPSIMGGARPKCVVKHENELWLAKFPSPKDQFNNAIVEHSCMELARKAGANVATTKLHHLNDRRAIVLVKRFDRAKIDDVEHRLGFVSALTVFGVSETDYQAWSYPALAHDHVRRTDFVDTRSELFRRMVFNIAIRNNDDHPRNHGFLWLDQKWSLSPAYDLVASPCALGVNTQFNLAMTVGKEGRQASVSNALSAHKYFGLTYQDAVNIVQEVFEAVSGWRHVLSNHGMNDKEQEKFTGSFMELDANDLVLAPKKTVLPKVR